MTFRPKVPGGGGVPVFHPQRKGETTFLISLSELRLCWALAPGYAELRTGPICNKHFLRLLAGGAIGVAKKTMVGFLLWFEICFFVLIAPKTMGFDALGRWLILRCQSGTMKKKQWRENNMSITVNIYYSGKNGAARQFAEEMMESGMVTALRQFLLSGACAYRKQYSVFQEI